MDLLCFEGCVVVIGIGTSVSYHIASFGNALMKKAKTLNSRNRISFIDSKGGFQNDNSKNEM